MIREIGVNELDKVHNIALDVWEKTYSSIISKEQIEFMFDKMYTLESLAEQMKSGHIFLIHETDEGINGFCSYCIEQNGVKIPKLYVSLTKQKLGIGRSLIDAVKERAKQAGKDCIRLNVNRKNPAFHFYIKYGFSIEETVDIPYYTFVLNDYVMKFELLSK